ncbi:MAG: hypothetical protein FD180_754 [Planctomycetota bacterium]|nr:MAG: hypothetical protein FD180_754 [Planctomycetota bacterium]
MTVGGENVKRRLIAAGAGGLAVLVAALAAPSGAQRGYFAATLAPALLALVLPFGLPVERNARADALLPLASGLATMIALAGFCAVDPGIGNLLGAAVFFVSWAILITGLFRAGARWGAAAGHLAAGGAGLFLCATHLLFDPIVAAAQNTAFRRFAISFAVDSNPSLILSAAFWQRDLLMTSYVYVRSDIGGFHPHAYAAWGWVAAAYSAVGVAGWLVGKRRAEEAVE